LPNQHPAASWHLICLRLQFANDPYLSTAILTFSLCVSTSLFRQSSPSNFYNTTWAPIEQTDTVKAHPRVWARIGCACPSARSGPLFSGRFVGLQRLSQPCGTCSAPGTQKLRTYAERRWLASLSASTIHLKTLTVSSVSKHIQSTSPTTPSN
ncbi:unnamed protein product, partial [Ectocarpus sp. 8 AP-2014]